MAQIHATEQDIIDLLNDQPFYQFKMKLASDDPLSAEPPIPFFTNVDRIGVEQHLEHCDTCRTTAMLMQWYRPEIILEVCAQEADEIGIRAQDK